MQEQPSTRFNINLRGEEIVVEYTPAYWGGADRFAYLSPHDPPRPHALSESGCLLHFADGTLVNAVGGPEAFAAWIAERLLEAQELQKPTPDRRRAQKEGGHAARVAEEKDDDRPLTQRDLF